MLVGERVVLRTVRQCDLDQLYDLMADVRTIFHRGCAQDVHLFAIVRGEHRPLAGLLADRPLEGGREVDHGC